MNNRKLRDEISINNMNSYIKTTTISVVIAALILFFTPPILSIFLIIISWAAYRYGLKRALIPLVFMVIIGTATRGEGMNSIYRRIPLFVSGAVVCGLLSYGRKLNLDVKVGEIRFKALFKGTPVPVFTWTKKNGEFVLTEYNDAGFQITDGKIAEVVGQTASEFYKENPEVLANLYKAYRTRNTIREEGYFKFITTGKNLYIDASFVYIAPDKVMIHAEDITERRVADEKFRLVFENSPIAKIIADRNGIIVLSNRQAGILTGYDTHELERKHLEDIMPERFREIHRAAYFREKVFRPLHFEKELHVLHKDGHEIPVEVGLNPITINGEEFILGTIIDITERQKAVQEKERLLQLEKAAKEEAENASKAKDEFLAIVSHELKTPLSSILGYSSLLTSGKLGNNTEAMKLALSTIERSARNQASLIEDLLDISRIVSGRMQVKKLIVGISGIVHQACESFAVSAALKGVDLKCEDCTDKLFVVGDPGRLQQILSNLVDNAVKFTPKGGKVNVGIVAERLQVHIIVKDTGIGIEPEFMSKLFQRFNQESTGIRRLGQGLGLGLSIARSLTELQGGSIKAESEGRGKGATFTVTLPLSSPPLEESAIRGLTHDITKTTLDGLTILAIDDDRDTLDMLKLALERYGATVLVAESAEEGRTAGEKTKLDVIVCDIGLPVVSGYEFIRSLRSENITTPALALTAFSGDEYAKMATEAGFDHYLAKPIEIGMLINGISYVLGLHSPSQP